LALILCAEPVSVKHTFIDGKPVWGSLSQTQLDEAQLVADVKSGLAELLKKVDH